MIRLFFAVPIGDENTKIINRLRSLNEGADGVKWTVDLNLHITLFFIGDTANENLQPITEQMNSIGSICSPFKLEFERYELRGKSSKPSMIWATFIRSEAFSSLNKRLREHFGFASAEISNHPDPIPHCTLARIKKKINKSSVVFPAEGLKPIEVNRIELWKTTGAIYERLFSKTLKA